MESKEPGEASDARFRRNKSRRIILGIVGVVVFAFVLYVLWHVLYGFIDPASDDSTAKRDLVQAFAVIAAGLIAFGTLLVGWLNLRHNQETLRVQQENTQRTLDQQRTIEEQRAQDTILQEYIDLMGELLLKEDLRSTNEPINKPMAAVLELLSKEKPKEKAALAKEQAKDLQTKKTRKQTIRSLASEHTRTALRRLDGERKGIVLQFLSSEDLIRVYSPEEAKGPVIGLWEADLRGAILRGSALPCANLSGARLSKADFTGASLYRADLSSADLSGAKLTATLGYANLENTNLSGADLSKAAVSPEQLNTAWSLKGATMPDGSKHD
jgi:uncharacterized protein YjbI with pentapeptide repeats